MYSSIVLNGMMVRVDGMCFMSLIDGKASRGRKKLVRGIDNSRGRPGVANPVSWDGSVMRRSIN